MEKHAKFFCENCGAEVPQNAKMCRHCGRFFTSVRCPACGATGTNSQFADGCPVCGYAVGKGKKSAAAEKATFKEKTAGRKSRANLRLEIESRNSRTFARRKMSDGALPIWFYLIIALVFLGFLGGSAKYLGLF